MFDLCDPNSFGQSSLLHTFMARVWGCVRCEGHLFSDSRLVQGRIAHLVCNQGALKRVISATFSLTQGWFKGEFALPALKTLTEEYQYGYQPLEVEATLAGFRSIQSGVIIATYADPNLHNSLKDKKILYAYDSKNNNVIHPTSTHINGLCVGTPPLSRTQLGKIKTLRTVTTGGSSSSEFAGANWVNGIATIFQNLPTQSVSLKSIPISPPYALSSVKDFLQDASKSSFWHFLCGPENGALNRLEAVPSLLQVFSSTSLGFRLQLGAQAREALKGKNKHITAAHSEKKTNPTCGPRRSGGGHWQNWR